MPITVRVRDFQSIVDATVVIDGFTVITGTNNSGKTALLRALKGVFTNAPPGPLVRHGCSHLIVDIDFGDGNTVCWEKGWEKPERKGKTINRYTVNGKLLDTVGRGVPPEVEALGIHQIQAGAGRLWPQVADQFEGVLFLVGSPGSAVAEAVADVDRVGKLSDALKLSESDRRSTNSKLKVRRDDESTLTEELARYEGLDHVDTNVTALEQLLVECEKVQGGIASIMGLKTRVEGAQTRVVGLEGVEAIKVPSPKVVADTEALRDEYTALKGVHARFVNIREGVVALEGVEDIPIPDTGAEIRKVQHAAQTLAAIQARQTQTSKTVRRLEGVEDVDIPTKGAVDKVKQAVGAVTSLRLRYKSALHQVGTVEDTLGSTQVELTQAVDLVDTLIEEMGICPTCRRSVEATP